jgi:hypothetical protein
MGLVEFTLPLTLQKAYYDVFHLSDDNRSPNTSKASLEEKKQYSMYLVKHDWFPELPKNQSGMKVLKRTQ